MIELVLIAVLAAFLWPVVIRWSRLLDAIAALDTLRPDPADVADLEADLPHMPGDPHFLLNATDIEYLDAVARYRESRRSEVDL